MFAVELSDCTDAKNYIKSQKAEAYRLKKKLDFTFVFISGLTCDNPGKLSRLTNS